MKVFDSKIVSDKTEIANNLNKFYINRILETFYSNQIGCI